MKVKKQLEANKKKAKKITSNETKKLYFISFF